MVLQTVSPLQDRWARAIIIKRARVSAAGRDEEDCESVDVAVTGTGMRGVDVFLTICRTKMCAGSVYWRSGRL